MRIFRSLALIVFYLGLPVPIYWFILHPFTNFWRHNIRAAFWFAGLFAWTLGAIFITVFRHQMLGGNIPSPLAAILASVLIAADFVLLFYSDKYLGTRKLVGHAELSGKSELITSGLYKHVRHPRYAGMISAVVGACILSQTKFAWIVSAIWCALVLFSILLEEREMRRRFGAVYETYSHDTPRFFPRF